MKNFLMLAVGFLALAMGVSAKSFTLSSPNGRLKAQVNAGQTITYSLSFNGQNLLNPSQISMQIDGEKTWGVGSRLVSSKKSKHSGTVKALFYKKAEISDDYNQLSLRFGTFNVVFRAYDEGFAYRFEATGNAKCNIEGEQAELNFAKNFATWMPYVSKEGDFEKQFYSSFESPYTIVSVDSFDAGRLAFLPFIVKADNGVRLVVEESNVEAYPGMFVKKGTKPNSLTSQHAPYDKKTTAFIAKADGRRVFPWRIVSVAATDADILNNDMVYRLASPSRIEDTSWIKPGKVAWDWWNDWGVYGVDFRSGINTKTYKYYIDFAARNGISYIMMDDGWFDRKAADIFKVVPDIDLKDIIDYGKEKGVGVILWATCGTFGGDMERACSHYAAMGVKGFKIDFIDRNDAWGINYIFKAAKTAAKYHLFVDFHGICPPTGLNRTYPNVLNFEGVYGMEQNKWGALPQNDQVTYAVTVPFARNLTGPMDYTQGAMINANRKNFAPSNGHPMSQGTRCAQLAEYVVFLSPLNMLCDSPVNYEANPECTDFISRVPVVWDETVALKSSIGEYVAVARRSGQKWYVGALTNWTPRDMELDLSPLKVAGRTAKVYHDGVNADRYGEDWTLDEVTIPADGKLKVHLAPGGGAAIEI